MRREREIESLCELRELAVELQNGIDGIVSVADGRAVQSCSEEVYISEVRKMRRVLSRARACITGLAIDESGIFQRQRV